MGQLGPDWILAVTNVLSLVLLAADSVQIDRSVSEYVRTMWGWRSGTYDRGWVRHVCIRKF